MPLASLVTGVIAAGYMVHDGEVSLERMAAILPINFTHICYINSYFRYIFMSYSIVNRSCINLKNYKNCQLYEIFIKS